MEVDTEKLKAYLANLEARRDNAIADALEDKDNIIEERLNEAKETIPIQVEKELTDNAEAPYKHDIELCKSFLKQEDPKQEDIKI